MVNQSVHRAADDLLDLVTQHLSGGRVDKSGESALVKPEKALAGRGEQQFILLAEPSQRRLGPRALGEAAPQFQLGDHLPRQGLQGVLLLRRQCARHLVNDTEGAEGVTVGSDQGRAGIEPDGGVPRDQWVIGEAWVGSGIRDDEDFGLEQGVGAERHVARCLAGVQSRSSP